MGEPRGPLTEGSFGGGRFGVFSVRFLVWLEQTGKSGFVRGGVIREVGNVFGRPIISFGRALISFGKGLLD